MNEWAIVHWKGVDEHGKEVLNSKLQDEKLPKAFEVGRYKVSKCWDIAIQQMKAGGTYKFSCPQDLDLGPDSIRSHAIGTSAPITGDMTYEVEILQAGLNPPMLKTLYHPFKGIKNDVCFYLVSAGSDGKGSPYAVEASEKDKYYPKSTGAFNVALGDYHGKASNNKMQQWKFNAVSDTIESCGHSNSALLEGTNKNLITYKNKKYPVQRFKYDLNTRTLTGMQTGNTIGVEGSKFVKGTNIASFKNDKSNPGHKWDIVYCV